MGIWEFFGEPTKPRSSSSSSSSLRLEEQRSKVDEVKTSGERVSGWGPGMLNEHQRSEVDWDIDGGHDGPGAGTDTDHTPHVAPEYVTLKVKVETGVRIHFLHRCGVNEAVM